MNNKDLLPKTQKQWLQFIIKVEKEINKKEREFKKIPAEEWLKKIEGIEPKYYRHGVLLEEKPDEGKSCTTVYEGKDVVVKDCYVGPDDEPDIRDRTEYLRVAFDGTTIRYRVREFYEGASFNLIVDGIEVIVPDTYDWGCGVEFFIDLGEQHIMGAISSCTYKVSLFNIPYSNRRTAMDVKTLSLLQCARKKPHFTKEQKAIREALRGFGLPMDVPIGSFNGEGLRAQESVEADEE